MNTISVHKFFFGFFVYLVAVVFFVVSVVFFIFIVVSFPQASSRMTTTV